MKYDPEYWKNHYPTKEEALLVMEACKEHECSRCPYDEVGCNHFIVFDLAINTTKEFIEENQNLKEALAELQAEFTKYINGGTDEI